jgi:hypothetical protein
VKRFRIDRKGDRVRLRIAQQHRIAPFITIFVTVGMVFAAQWIFERFGVRFSTILPVLLLLPLPILLSVSQLWSLTSRKIFEFSPDEVTVLTSLLGVQVRKQLFRIADVHHFGFDLFGHSLTPVFRLDVKGKWITLAEVASRVEVDAVVKALRAEGIHLPE